MDVDGVRERIGQLMTAFRAGDSRAANELVEIFHPELRRLAAQYLRQERGAHSWQPTLLVNELYLQLVRIRALRPVENGGADDRAAFLSLAGLLMRRLLIHHARPLSHSAVKLPLEEDMVLAAHSGTLAETEVLLERLGNIRPRLREVVELRVFEGLTGEEIAARLNCGPATVARDWNFARHWLEKELTRSGTC
jgi:RNA polymerase sigma factor (TIGR02999 family)